KRTGDSNKHSFQSPGKALTFSWRIATCACVPTGVSKPNPSKRGSSWEGHGGEFDFFHVLHHHGGGGWPAEVVAEAAADLPGRSGEAARHHQQPQRPAGPAPPVHNVVHAMER
ncbi:hypothetical protein EK904_010649, partial [Melospiza melodia maxima]